MCIGTLINNQLRNSGKTTFILQKVIEYALNHPDQSVLLAMSHIVILDCPLPSNIKVIKTKSIYDVDKHFTASPHTVVEIDHHIKDEALIDQHRIIQKYLEIIKHLENELLRCKQKLDAIEVLLKS